MKKFNVPEGKVSVGYKIKLYPKKEQAEFLDKCIDINRKVYNWTLERQRDNYILWTKGESKNKFLRFEQLESMFYKFRNENSYLLEVPCTSARNAILRAIDGFKRFFNKETNYPKFKTKKKSKKSYTTNGNRMYFEDSKIRIEGLPKGELIETKIHSGYTIKTSPKYFYNPVITKSPTGEYWLSYNLFEDKEKYINSIKSLNKSEPIGIDINKNTINLSNGIVYRRPNIEKDKRRLKRYQRSYQRGIDRRKREITNLDNDNILPSKRSEKRKIRVAKQYNKIHNKGENFIQQISSDIIKMNPETIVMETLKVEDMKSNHYMAKNIQFVSFYRPIEVIKYKSDRYDIKFKQAPLEYKSSKLCSNCGNIKEIYGNKIYICPHCGLRIDRDLNAAINLQKLA